MHATVPKALKSILVRVQARVQGTPLDLQNTHPNCRVARRIPRRKLVPTSPPQHREGKPPMLASSTPGRLFPGIFSPAPIPLRELEGQSRPKRQLSLTRALSWFTSSGLKVRPLHPGPAPLPSRPSLSLKARSLVPAQPEAQSKGLCFLSPESCQEAWITSPPWGQCSRGTGRAQLALTRASAKQAPADFQGLVSTAVGGAPEARKGRSKLCRPFKKGDLEMNSPVRCWLPRYRGEGP